jgi:DNA-binding FadR family transcriptional regulator
MPKHVATEVAHSLRRRIEAGEWSDTRRLPNERDLALEYRVARNTMRRAMDAIAADGTVTRHVGRGTFLKIDDRSEIFAILQSISGTSPVDMMAVRMILEPRAAALAATNASARELQDIATAHAESLKSAEMETFEHWDAELHQKIFVGSRNDLLGHLHDLMRLIRGQAPWLDLKRRSFSEERMQIYCREHAQVVEALLRRNPEEAAAAMRAHLDTVHRNLFGRVL